MGLLLFSISATFAGGEAGDEALSSYGAFVRSHGLEPTDRQAEPNRRLHPGGPRNIEAFALGHDLGRLPAPEERPRLERDAEGRVTLVYPVATDVAGEVRVQPVYTTDMVDWQAAGVIDERIGTRRGREWRRAVFPDSGTRQLAVALRIEFSSGDSDIRPLALDGDEMVPSDHQSCCSVVTDPVGYVTMYVYGGDNGRRSYSALSVPMLRPAIIGGTVQEIAGNRIRTNVTGNDQEDLGPTASGRATHFLEVREGARAGWLVDVVHWDGESLYLAEDAEEAGILAPGDAVLVRPHWTLDSFFFFTDPDVAVRGSTVQAEADQALVYDAATQQFETFWYWSDGGESGWVDSVGEPADDVTVYPARGLVVSRAAPEVVEFIVLGEVRMTPLQAEVLPGFNVLPNPFPVEYTLAKSGLSESGLRGAEFQEAADSIQAPLIGGGFEPYWLSTMPGAEGYVDFNYKPAGDKAFVDAGQGFVLQRRGEEGFWWTSPVPYFLE